MSGASASSYRIGVRKKKNDSSGTQDGLSTVLGHFDVTSSIASASGELAALARALGNDGEMESALGGVAAQDELEQTLMRQADERIRAQDDAADQKRLKRTEKDISDVRAKMNTLSRRLGNRQTLLSERQVIKDQLQELRSGLQSLDNDHRDILARISDRDRAAQDASAPSSRHGPSTTSGSRHTSLASRRPVESERDRLIREGKITPFQAQDLEKSDKIIRKDGAQRSKNHGTFGARNDVEMSRRSGMVARGGRHEKETAASALESDRATGLPASGSPESLRKRKRRAGRVESDDDEDVAEVSASRQESKIHIATESGLDPQEEGRPAKPSLRRTRKRRRSISTESNSDASVPEDGVFRPDSSSSSSSYDAGSQLESDAEEDPLLSDDDGASPGSAHRSFVPNPSTYADDGDEAVFQARLENWARSRARRRARLEGNGSAESREALDLQNDDADDFDPTETEPFLPHPELRDHSVDARLNVPGDVWEKLLDYQKTGVRWMWELRRREVGGIVGDEMGLGKTVQVIALLASLHRSRLLRLPVLVLCPATVLRQWVQEFHKWWPPLRVAVLHSSGSGMEGDAVGRGWGGSMDEEEFFSDDSERGGRRAKKATGRRKPGKVDGRAASLVERISEQGHVLITTYTSAQLHRDLLLPVEWACAVLDEGHKIRNPDADVTLVCKQLRTPHRLILSGTPIQNNLTELWSLLDFVYPGRLGTLPVFHAQFSLPIRLGGYANASNMQVQAAYRCATVLRDLITPYLLRRMKADVAHQLPGKSEQVLFCRLSAEQRKVYEGFLSGKEVEAILGGKRHVLFGIDYLRKICNHPDLLQRVEREGNPDFGDYQKSGKMKVVKALLELWRDGDHKVLLFCQTRQMLDILERFVRSESYPYRRMDGETAIKNRMTLVDEFNLDPSVYVFLLTTKVGGLGVNLTGADRVIIFDPDWNPSTDVQARERAWRLGQKREVTIYRLMTSGTIEEKIYHRQIFKQFLTNKILKDPKQRRFFKANDLHDLFSLSSGTEKRTETGELFRDMDMDVEIKVGKDKSSDRSKKGKKKRQVAILGEINDLDKAEDYRPAQEEEENNDVPRGNTGAGPDEDSRILKSLFEMTGVHSALKHDVIMDSANPEFVIVEKEAAKIADAAIAALKESKRQRRREDVSVPTWTGMSGQAGAQRVSHGPAKRFGTKLNSRFGASSSKAPLVGSLGQNNAQSQSMSSASILASLQDKTSGPTTTVLGGRQLVSGAGEQSGGNFATLAEEITDHLVRHDGRSTTGDIVNAFRSKIPESSGGEGVLAFKKILKELATMEKDASGKGCWILKQDFA
ncbi:hypothetical protein M427DRAFT_52512 [Gonapodya prolifera JEL478]|uniref:Uncharacterized protein n=1 Tax=Gonapodya prolifera (strain JEL478) TaxID=1344416 RepID=A0A139AUA7_GONPJ|nr:hypothetical protein M427DRAFT_52512 [Gonapodya prolifera JEL478]|eukprot:KXS20289.1 hypothetical protein M427DRAFT_52512 [Gonapodya prolifera JEL478]